MQSKTASTNALLGLLISVFLLVGVAPAASQVYKKCDANGVCSYTDQPQAGAEAIEVRAVVTEFERVASPVITPAPTLEPTEVTGPPEVTVSITSPLHRDTVRSNGGEFEVIWAADIKNLDGDPVYQLRLDTVPVYEGPLTQVILRDVSRGERRLQVRVFSADGTELAQSDTVEFYVQRVSVFSPARQGDAGGNR
ncbi:DUF4124 domain-containing protein [Pseudidiomarina mangrovi]|uniref:DUF4124 domain-containing protein n=1 Tax=Pseudidiomarina mangrovi TaxID=2487133 RepID=UPI000FCAAEB3|nr:DUF4124 domain-containing protein [Pseudidiomarina mangrovi]